MKFQYLGTAAAEGIPALLCGCEVCTRSRKLGGRAMRTRTQAIIDDKLLIDFPADTLLHTHIHNIDLLGVNNCLITHNHGDHLYVAELEMLLNKAVAEQEYEKAAEYRDRIKELESRN